MYKHIALGGTFDGLHKGHKFFLSQAFNEAARVTIGLTSEVYIRRFKHGTHVSPYSARYGALTKWLRNKNLAERTTIVTLDDSFGPAVLGDMFDSIAVTEDNRSVGDEINRLRAQRGADPLTLIEIALVEAEDDVPISSSRIRNREIDSEGRLYLPQVIRRQLQEPMGKLLSGEDIEKAILAHKDAVTVCVGDITTQTFFFRGVQPSLAIIDCMVGRKPFQSLADYKFPKKYTVTHVKSGPGYIAKKAIQAIKVWTRTIKQRKRMVLVVDGEEDLLALPAMMYAPIGSFVYYGQPNGALWVNGPSYRGGLVEVEVTHKKKKEAIELLRMFL